MGGLLGRLQKSVSRALRHRLGRRVTAARHAALAARGAVPAGRAITVARIIGNDLFPRHADGQALRNLDFILDHEPDFADTTKLFILNRLFDRDAAAATAALIRSRGHAVLDLPFDPAVYLSSRCDWSFLGDDLETALNALTQLDPDRVDRARLWAIRAKLAAAIDINGARNAAMQTAFDAGADWVLVLDGSCFLTPEAFARIAADLRAAPFAPCLVLPMQRVTDNAQIGAMTLTPNWTEEPQLAFHRTTDSRFDARFPYGLRDKTALLSVLDVPGAWDGWAFADFLPEPQGSADRNWYKRATAPVLRLSSGASGGALEQTGAQKRRYLARNAAIFGTIALLDQRHGASDADQTRRLLGL